MAVTRQDLDDFHQFATGILAQGVPRSITELAAQWQAARERQQVNAAIRAGLADIDAGRVQDFDEFEQEMRTKYGIPKQ
jgi:predicted transcriptional regulator